MLQQNKIHSVNYVIVAHKLHKIQFYIPRRIKIMQFAQQESGLAT
jgi:hypothetical protein